MESSFATKKSVASNTLLLTVLILAPMAAWCGMGEDWAAGVSLKVVAQQSVPPTAHPAVVAAPPAQRLTEQEASQLYWWSARRPSEGDLLDSRWSREALAGESIDEPESLSFSKDSNVAAAPRHPAISRLRARREVAPSSFSESPDPVEIVTSALFEIGSQAYWCRLSEGDRMICMIAHGPKKSDVEDAPVTYQVFRRTTQGGVQ